MEPSSKGPISVDGGGPKRQPQVIDVKAEASAAGPAAEKAAGPKPAAATPAPSGAAPLTQANVRPSAFPPRPAVQATPEPTPAAAPVIKTKKAKPHYAYAILLGALTALAGSVALHMINDPQQQMVGLSAKVAQLQDQLAKVADISARSRLSGEADHARVTALSAEIAKVSGPKNEMAVTQNSSANPAVAAATPTPTKPARAVATPNTPAPVAANPAKAAKAMTPAAADAASAPMVPDLATVASGSTPAASDAKTAHAASATAPVVPGPAAPGPAIASAVPKPDVAFPVVQSAASIAALAAVTASLSSLQGKVASLDQTLPKVDATLAAHETAIKANQAQIVKAMATPNGAAVAVVSQSIAAALAQGRAFPTQFKALQGLHVDAGLLAPLAKVADKGPASTTALASSFTPELAAITQAETPATPAPQGVMGWIGSKAATLVQLRDTSLPMGHAPGAAAAKVEEALRHGDATDAWKDWNAMSEAAKKLSAGWVAPLQDRVEAEAAVQKLNEGALAAMTGPSTHP